MGQITIWEIKIQMVKRYGLKKQICKVNPKNGFYLRAKHGLIKSGFLKDQLGLICEGRKEPVEKKKREGGGGEPSQKGMETEFLHGFYEIMHEFPCFVGYLLAQI